MVLWADSFTNGLDPQIPDGDGAVLEAAGLEVLVSAGDACCGVTWISTGQLDGARKQLSHLLEVLGPYAVNGIPIIGVEPSCMAVLRGDLTELLPDDPRAHAVAGRHLHARRGADGPRPGQACARAGRRRGSTTSRPLSSRIATSTRCLGSLPIAS